MRIALIAILAISTQYVLGGSAASDALTELQALRKGQQDVTVNLTPGRYELPESGLYLEDLTNVTINAQGVTLVATNPLASALFINNCKNLTVRGLTVDYDPLPFTQGSLTHIDLETRTASVSIHTGYPDLSPEYLVNRMHLFEQDAHRWKVGAPDYYLKKFERVDDRHGLLHFQESEQWDDYIEVGDRVAFNIRKAAAIQIKEGTAGIHFEDCTIHAGPGLGILVRFGEDAGLYERLRVLPGPMPEGATEPRLLSTCADAFNAAYTRKGPVLDDCEFAYMGDDSVNLHGVTLPVLEWEDSRTCLSMRPLGNEGFDTLLRAGDEARFLLEPNFKVIETATIESIDRVDASVEKWHAAAQRIWPSFRKSKKATFYRIRFTEALSDVPAGRTFCEFFASSAPDYVIKNSYFHDHRARGLRLMSGNGLVENNRFERLKGPAISAGPEFAYWKEAGWVHDLTIRNNTISNVGEGAHIFSKESYTLGAISIFAHVLPEGEDTYYFPGNENLLIEANDIKECAMDAISIVASKGVVIRNNQIADVNLTVPGDAGSEYGILSGQPISIIQSEALLENNAIRIATVRAEPEVSQLIDEMGDNAQCDLIASAVTGKPRIEENVGYVNAEDKNGLRCFWIKGEGRRDLGQQFQVTTAFKASKLALQINSATRNQDVNAPFSLTFARHDPGSPTPGEILGTYRGLVPGKHAKLHSGQWLCLKFPELALAPGNYSFLLQFETAGNSGRSIVLNASADPNAYAGGKGIQSQSKAPEKLQYGRPINFILSNAEVTHDEVEHDVVNSPRILNVDQRGGSDYSSLSAAVMDVQPGDTIRLVPGSGPYREPLYIKRSGIENAPITIEGNGEVITGFEPIGPFREEAGSYVCDLHLEFPFVISYQGQRLLQDAQTGQFSEYARLSDDRKQLKLLPGVSRDGWELSTRYFAVRVENVSHHIYRNLKASGAMNDGFNLHGQGEGLVFENIDGFQNLDEGFSAHDTISCEIINSSFYENDTGIGNIGASRMIASNIDLYNNLGWGLWLRGCYAKLSEVNVWENGITQIYLSGDAEVEVSNVIAREPTWDKRLWVSYKESAKAASPVALIVDDEVALTGESITVNVVTDLSQKQQ